MYAAPIQQLIHELIKLPGIGEKTAERLTFHLLSSGRDEAMKLSHAINDLREKIKLCSSCCNMSTSEKCEICSNLKRDLKIVCAVETSKDVWAIEKTGSYSGLYHVLQGTISPLDGIGPEDLTIDKLVQRIKNNQIEEIIIATNPTAEGEATAFYIQKKLKTIKVRVTRIAKGIPSGSTMEYVNRFTITDAIKERRNFICEDRTAT